MVVSFRSHISDLGVFPKPCSGRQKNANTVFSPLKFREFNQGFSGACKNDIEQFYRQGVQKRGCSIETLTEDAAPFRVWLVNTDCKRFARQVKYWLLWSGDGERKRKGQQLRGYDTSVFWAARGQTFAWSHGARRTGNRDPDPVFGAVLEQEENQKVVRSCLTVPIKVWRKAPFSPVHRSRIKYDLKKDI